jgi:parvulin-like peptidyl-prolyl isomerase
MKLPYKEFGPFPRVNPPVDDPVVVGTSFGLDVGKTSGLLDTKQGIYVLKVLERTKADSAAFLKELDSYRPRMINLARQDRVRSYLEALRQAAKIVDDRKKVLQQTGPAPTS